MQSDTDSMTPNGQSVTLGEDRILKWYPRYSIEMERYVITLLNDENILESRVELVPSTYIPDYESWQIPSQLALDSGKVYKWRIETAGEFFEGYETAGSESPWATFLYIEP